MAQADLRVKGGFFFPLHCSLSFGGDSVEILLRAEQLIITDSQQFNGQESALIAAHCRRSLSGQGWEQHNLWGET